MTETKTGLESVFVPVRGFFHLVIRHWDLIRHSSFVIRAFG